MGGLKPPSSWPLILSQRSLYQLSYIPIKTLGGPSLAVSLLWQGDYVVNPMLYIYLTSHNVFPYPCTLDRLLVLLSAKRNFRIWFHILRRQFFLLDMLFMLKSCGLNGARTHDPNIASNRGFAPLIVF